MAERADEPRGRASSYAGLSGKTFRDVDLDVHAGEIVGIVGVHGSGREDVCRALFGAEPTMAGEVTLDGEKLDLSGTRAACAAGVGYVPAERKIEGMVGPMSVADNMTLTKQKSRCTGPLVVAAEAGRRWSTSWIERLSIRTPHRGTAIQRLSGGNQQKVVLARWLVAGDIRLLLLDHPTRGLDIGARSEVYRLMRELANSGVATVLLADSLEEAIGMSDRIIVMSDGRATTEVALPLRRQADPARPREGDGVRRAHRSPPSRRRAAEPAVVKGGPTVAQRAHVVHARHRARRAARGPDDRRPRLPDPAQPHRRGPHLGAARRARRGRHAGRPVRRHRPVDRRAVLAVDGASSRCGCPTWAASPRSS